MAGVDAEADPGSFEYAYHLGCLLDHRPHMRVQGRNHATTLGVVGESVQVGQQRLPSQLVELRTGVVSVDSGVGSEDNDPGAGGDASIDEAVHLRKWVMLRIVEEHRHEAPDRLHLVRRELRGLTERVILEESLRAELGRHEPELTHLTEDARGVELVAPARDLADPQEIGAPAILDLIDRSVMRRSQLASGDNIGAGSSRNRLADSSLWGIGLSCSVSAGLRSSIDRVTTVLSHRPFNVKSLS